MGNTGSGTNGADQGQGIAINTNGVYVTGYFNGSPDFDPGLGTANLISNGSADIFVLKLDTAGNYIWAKNMGGTGADIGHSITIDASGNIYTTGRFSGTADFDPGTSTFNLTTNGGQDIFISRLDIIGNYVWAQSIGGTGADYSQSIAVDASRNIYTTGQFAGTTDFDPGVDSVMLTSIGNQDIFVLKLACADTTSFYLAVTECSESYTLNGEIYTASGIYTQRFPNAFGCDSILTIDLTFYQIEPVITIEVDTLSTTQNYATYQWLKNGSIILGATNAKYTVTENADYQVIVTDENGCRDTSAIYTVTNHGVGTEDGHGIGKQIHIFPNPTNGLIHINSPVAVNAVLAGIDGRAVLSKENAKEIPVKNLSEGIYFLRIMDKEGRLIKVEKILKQ